MLKSELSLKAKTVENRNFKNVIGIDDAIIYGQLVALEGEIKGMYPNGIPDQPSIRYDEIRHKIKTLYKENI